MTRPPAKVTRAILHSPPSTIHYKDSIAPQQRIFEERTSSTTTATGVITIMSSTAPSLASSVANYGGKALDSDQQSVPKFVASFVVAISILTIEIVVFILIKDKLKRIYKPRTYMVPEREQTVAPPPSWFGWVVPLFKTSNSEFIGKCGLDAYFFLRYLRTLLKIFVPIGAVVLPVLLPLNAVGGRGPDAVPPVQGLNLVAWGNVAPDQTSRYWVHLLLAIGVIAWICYVLFQELRGYIRVRQAYLTSPQHRLRASATTVLVNAIPPDWLTLEALEGLYDVFPGGIRNIWINRDYQELLDKIDLRNKYASNLEQAETDLIKAANKAHQKQVKAEAKKAGKKLSKAQQAEADRRQDEETERRAAAGGRTAGDPHEVMHSIRQILGKREKRSPVRPVDGDGVPKKGFMNRFNAVGRGVGGIGRSGLGFLDRSMSQENGFEPTNGSAAPNDQSKVLSTERPRPDRGSDPAESHYSSELTAVAGDRPTSTSPQELSETAANAGTGQPAGMQKRGLRGLMHRRDRIDVSGPELRAGRSRADDEVPLSNPTPTTPHMNSQATFAKHEINPEHKAGIMSKIPGMGKHEEKEQTVYEKAFDDSIPDDRKDAVWKQYVKEEDRPSMRLPLFGKQWIPSIPLIGKKVDTIYYCRKELARLNVEIEKDQSQPDKYPLMNSAFVQFNHQVAAHLACQALSHHLPQYMAPRHVEVSPGDVIWANMSVRWWERQLRSITVRLIVGALIFGWVFPVALTGLLSQVNFLTQLLPWLGWLNKLPSEILAAIQGVLPPVLLGLLMVVLPIVLRFLAKQSGVPTGMAVELQVQNMYFLFSFVQIFLVVSLSSSLTSVFKELYADPTKAPTLLAQSIPRGSNYFFQYMLLQAFSVSGGDLVQIGALIGWFVLAPLLDSTSRQKWRRNITLPTIQWGTFYPVYTNLACIGIIFSVISPLMIPFSIITFALFWVAYRYNTLFVNRYRFDTGGLLFPQAVNQLFTGIYFMELVLVGLFFLVRDQNNRVAAIPQAVIMVIVTALTVLFQLGVSRSFSPLYRYIPITLEDDAVARDEEFARSQQKKWRLGETDNGDLQDELEEKERRENESNRMMEGIEMKRIEPQPDRDRGRGRAPHQFGANLSVGDEHPLSRKKRGSWAAETRRRSRSRRSHDAGRDSDDEQDPRNQAQAQAQAQAPLPVRQQSLPTTAAAAAAAATPDSKPYPTRPQDQIGTSATHMSQHATDSKLTSDIEAQALSSQTTNLFAGLTDEIEDLTPAERDRLVERAFRHEALRARRPVVWIPQDPLGVCEDEIRRTEEVCGGNVWVSSRGAALDRRGRVLYRRNPPDFSEVDLIEL